MHTPLTPAKPRQRWPAGACDYDFVLGALNQGIAVVTGLQEHFDWRGVVGSAVGAGVGYGVGSALNNVDMNPYVKAGVTSFAAGTATAVARGGRVAIQQIATDSFNQVVAGALVDGMLSAGTQEDRLGGFIQQNQDSWDQRGLSGAQGSFRQGEILAQNAQARSDALYGWSTGNDGLGFKGNGGAGLLYGGVRASGNSENELYLSRATEERLISGQTVSDINPYVFGGDRPTAQVGFLINPATTGGAVGGGYQPIRPNGAGGPPGYDIRTDMPTGTPGYSRTDPNLGLGAPPQQGETRSWKDFLMGGLPPVPRALINAMDNLVFKAPSDILGENLEAAGQTRPDGSAAHHIVPYGDKRAQNIRDQLNNLGIKDLNSADNGVYLPQVPGSTAPGAYHPSLNSDDYHRQLQRDFDGITSKPDALDVLDRIRGRLLNSTYPGSKPVPPKR